MNKFFGHLHTINKHRWEVFKLSIKAGIPYRGLVHDLSKYSYEEFSEGVKYFTDGKYSPIVNCKKKNGYSRAWLHHKGRNKHHFEYWYDYASPNSKPIMPFKYTLEMICDRIAASKTYNKKNYDNGKPLEYFYKEKPKMVLNENLIDFLEEVFKRLKKDGEKVLNKKELFKLYNKYINKK